MSFPRVLVSRLLRALCLVITFLPRTSTAISLAHGQFERESSPTRHVFTLARRWLPDPPYQLGKRPGTDSPPPAAQSRDEQWRRFFWPGAQFESHDVPMMHQNRPSPLELQAERKLYIGQIFDAVWARTSTHAILDLEGDAKRAWAVDSRLAIERSFNAQHPRIAWSVDKKFARATEAIIRRSQEDYTSQGFSRSRQTGDHRWEEPNDQAYHLRKLESIARTTRALREDQWTAERGPTVEGATRRLQRQHEFELWESQRRQVTQRMAQLLRKDCTKPAPNA